MLVIRLFRIGRRNQPAFKIVVTDSRRSSTRGRFVEEVGVYNPVSKQRNIKGDRVKYWISVGAQPSASVHNMLVTDKIIEGAKIAKHKVVPPKVEVTPAAPSAPAAPTTETSSEPVADAAEPEPVPKPVEVAPDEKSPQSS